MILKTCLSADSCRKKQGSALCMACLYAVLAARFGLDAGVVDMAGRVLACFAPQRGEEPIFADPSDSGKLLSPLRLPQLH